MHTWSTLTTIYFSAKQTHLGNADVSCIELENHERTRWTWQLTQKEQWTVTGSQRHTGRGEGGRGSHLREQEQRHSGKTGLEGNAQFADYRIMSPFRFVLISGETWSMAWKLTKGCLYLKKINPTTKSKPKDLSRCVSFQVYSVYVRQDCGGSKKEH